MENLMRNATIGETANIAKDVNTAVTKAAIDDAYLNNQNAVLKTSYDTMLSGIGAFRGKELTDQIEAADTRRDNLLAAFIHLLKGFLLWEKDDATLAAAKKLLRIIESHGSNFSRLSHEKESAQYDALLLELETADAMAALEALGITGLIGAMKAAQTSFTALYQQSAETEAGKTTVAPSSIKKDTQTQLNAMIDYLNVMQKANAAVYGTLALNVEQLVGTLNQKIRTRGSSGSSDNTTTTGTETK
jgi:hypothetical protein